MMTHVQMVERRDEQVNRVTLIGQALGDPIRVKMLGLMARGRHGCDLPDLGLRLPAEAESLEGISVSEFMAYYHMGQSKVSYHMRVLKEAGLVTETTRGKWTFYSLDRRALRESLVHIQTSLLEG